ncbi:MAG: hypothetical protein V3R66_07080 [Rhodospirillales bacterium]
MDYRNLVNELADQLGPGVLNEYLQKASGALDVFDLAFEDGRLSQAIYNDYLTMCEEIGA